MRITVICKASTMIGLGHLIRTQSFINQVLQEWPSLTVDYIIIGEAKFVKLVTNKKINVFVLNNEAELCDIRNSDLLFLDMLDIDESILKLIQKFTKATIVLSPIFNCFHLVDYYFGRTKYLDFNPDDYPNLKVFAGLEYAIIQENCKVINAGIYEDNIKNQNMSVAISMGGGDASNKTLEVLRAVKKCKANVTFWVMVGEGYKHSFDHLIEEIRENTSHEIILAKTNSSMWNILKNCVLCILPGGITSYEAVYAGLPTINFFSEASQQFLLKEIAEHNAAYNFGVYSEETLNKITGFIDYLCENPKELLQMHINTKMLIDGGGAIRIFTRLLKMPVKQKILNRNVKQKISQLTN